MIAFPYNDSVNTMYALKPRLPEQLSLSDLIESLDYAKIDSLINQMKRQDVVVRFPKMKISSDNNLESHLKNMGIKSMFNPRDANFALMLDTNATTNKMEDELISRINDGAVEGRSLNSIVNSLINPGVYVDTVMHQVKIEIDGECYMFILYCSNKIYSILYVYSTTDALKTIGKLKTPIAINWVPTKNMPPSFEPTPIF